MEWLYLVWALVLWLGFLRLIRTKPKRKTEAEYKALNAEWQKNYKELLFNHRKLLVKHNAVVNQVNRKGGQSFLDGESPEFTPEEIKDLISLCHPDRHKDNPKAVRLTQKLLNLRGEM